MFQEPSWRYIDRAEVCRLRGIGRTKQFKDEKDGTFPSGERHGLRTIRWRSDVVAKWMENESARATERFLEISKRASQSAQKGVESRRKKRLCASDTVSQV